MRLADELPSSNHHSDTSSDSGSEETLGEAGGVGGAAGLAGHAWEASSSGDTSDESTSSSGSSDSSDTSTSSSSSSSSKAGSLPLSAGSDAAREQAQWHFNVTLRPCNGRLVMMWVTDSNELISIHLIDPSRDPSGNPTETISKGVHVTPLKVLSALSEYDNTNDLVEYLPGFFLLSITGNSHYYSLVVSERDKAAIIHKLPYNNSMSIMFYGRIYPGPSHSVLQLGGQRDEMPADHLYQVFPLEPSRSRVLPKTVLGANNATGGVLFADRFLVTFGGFRTEPYDTMMVYDVETGKSSTVTKVGAWPSGGQHACMIIKGSELYILGYHENGGFYSIPLAVVASKIRIEAIRKEFDAAVRSVVGDAASGAVPLSETGASAALADQASMDAKNLAGLYGLQAAAILDMAGDPRPVRDDDWSAAGKVDFVSLFSNQLQ